MSEQRLKLVREAEIAAEKVRKNADDEVAQSFAQGNKEARNLIEHAEKEFKAEYEAEMAKASAKADEGFRERMNGEQRICDNIRSHAHVNMDEAVDLIVGKVMESNGNS